LLATSDVDPTTHLGAYYEMDFLGAAGSANAKESNSYNRVSVTSMPRRLERSGPAPVGGAKLEPGDALYQWS